MLVLAVYAVVEGLFAIIRLRREIEDELLLGFGGVLSANLGAILIVRPQLGQVTTMSVLGTYEPVFGVVLVVLGFRLWRFKLESRADRA